MVGAFYCILHTSMYLLLDGQILQPNTDIVIKKADKGSCIVVQDRRSYVSEGKSHLDDTSTCIS